MIKEPRGDREGGEAGKAEMRGGDICILGVDTLSA